MTLGAHVLDIAVGEVRGLKALADQAMAQVGDEVFFAAPDAESNSIALNVKHVAGNLRSLWTDFLTADGGKPDRNRDSEFVLDAADTRAALLERWEAGRRALFAALETLPEAGLLRTVRIRGEPHTVVQAVDRQRTHYGYHVGRIVFLAKHGCGASWKTLSIARRRTQDAARATPERRA